MKSVPLSKKEISTMFYDENWNRLFIGDDTGSLWILDLSSSVLIHNYNILVST
jgi:hypothetical protein